MLDDIELNINSTKKNVQNAETKLKKAKKWHLSAKKVRMFIISIESLLSDNNWLDHRCCDSRSGHFEMRKPIHFTPTCGRMLEKNEKFIMYLISRNFVAKT